MQIKRFEAEDMTEALRMVKREFGDNAVILSAKESRPGGFFSAFRKKSVEITAATDYPLDGGSEEKDTDFSRQLSEQLAVETENDRVSLSSRASAFVPFAVRSNPQESIPANATPDRRMKRRATDASITDVPQDNSRRTAGDESRLDCDRQRMVAEPFYRHPAKRRIIAVVGPHGTGKTTAIAKLASHCLLVEKKTIALVSLDRFRIGANDMLARVSRILNVPFTIARDVDQMQAVLNNQADADVVFIDTPGMGDTEETRLSEIGQLLEAAKPDEIHLAVNVAVRQSVLGRWIETFLPLGVNRLFFTHMDECTPDRRIMDLIDSHALSSAFYSDGVDLFDHLHEFSVDGLNRFSVPPLPRRQRVTDFPTDKRTQPVQVPAIHFVANRNSELFHHPDCKSVKRINAENITAFTSIEQAMDEGFKPCRACCNNEITRKTLPETVIQRRASAI